MNLAADGFDWDDGNRAKCGKHGVAIDEIEALFHSAVLVAPDPKHSGKETRFIAIGRNEEGRPMFVAFTFRDQGGLRLVRPVSARYMHAKEVASYEARS
jgi:uncharacterized DUF497 family protein